jgi:hypothetical protein
MSPASYRAAPPRVGFTSVPQAFRPPTGGRGKGVRPAEPRRSRGRPRRRTEVGAGAADGERHNHGRLPGYGATQLIRIFATIPRALQSNTCSGGAGTLQQLSTAGVTRFVNHAGTSSFLPHYAGGIDALDHPGGHDMHGESYESTYRLRTPRCSARPSAARRCRPEPG